MIISLAPLQGYTEYPFRNAHASIIGGVDKFYTPFLRFENDGSLRSKYLKDIASKNNKNIPLIPQILVNNGTDFLKLAVLIEEQGYSEVNWNLGCPYPMVAKRGLGSGLLNNPDKIRSILDEVMAKTKLKVSVKFRSGYESDEEIHKVIEVFNAYPLHELIYHPRIGKKLYKGHANVDLFQAIQKCSHHKLAYNGDVVSVQSIKERSFLNHEAQHVMIGRGLLSNPFLASDIKQQSCLGEQHKRSMFMNFHNELFENYRASLSGDSHLLNKFTHFWEYFSQLFVESKKVYKSIKKCKNAVILDKTIHFIIQNHTFIEL